MTQRAHRTWIMIGLNFKVVDTGGNIKAWRLDIDDSRYVLVSTEDGEAFSDDSASWCWSEYILDVPAGAGGVGLNHEAAALWAYAHVLSLRHAEKHT